MPANSRWDLIQRLKVNASELSASDVTIITLWFRLNAFMCITAEATHKNTGPAARFSFIF
jgi:hypothetical protein